MKHEVPPRAEDHLVMPSGDDFDITLAQAARYKKMREQKRVRPKLHILSVEDEPFLRKLMQEALRELYEIITCPSAEEGWKFYLEGAPDIAFLDIGLPDSGGHELAHRIKEFDPDAYVVMLTASRRPEDIERARDNRVNGFVIKPFNRKKLDECIGQYRVGRG